MIRPLLLLALVSIAACAQARQPAGGPPVEHPPRVVDVTPEPYSVLTALDRPVVFRFDERLSERLQGVREWRDAVIVSPETSEVRVRRGRRQVSVSLAGGWQPGLVYRVTVLPVLRDLFNNVIPDPIELVFSTGAPIAETAVAGVIEDRLTGNAVAAARVEATHLEDGHTYVAMTDTAGFFALRHLPVGGYDVLTWLDLNRNRVPDFAEPQDEASVALAEGDTVVVEMRLLPGDTTPARLLRAEALDSITIELNFDDYFEPGPVEGTAAVYTLPDSTFVGRGTLLHGTALDSLRIARQEAAAAAADTLPADTLPMETQPDTAGAAPQRPADADRQARRPADPARPPLPARVLLVELDTALEWETAYFVVVADVANIHGVPGGGGTASFRTPPAPEQPADAPPAEVPPDEVPPDEVPPDEAPPPSR
jgi:hypothetical protein